MLGTKFGISSRCFPSTILKLGYQPETIPKGNCYQFQCAAEGREVYVLVAGQKVVCQQNSQKLSVKGYSGYIVCPDNIFKFCRYKRFCPNFCSANGVCINNRCICLKGFYGPDCYSNKPV
ncbi:leishmanolysin family protein, putative [Ichthyophthirius multifiliis]|uniref:Leishmanolysin family protein, putative n=1 Tax=Ichthyophthirius multifiliis TaxID=5932 RepID=G0QLE9_ICHMU|nr:leishmanolysin family protein, putative [Ichthyophthirius multifiliis]EGR33956.1 leishmanolysin family protein, putative [Ichthyophthirius multifiliis]|eukprot:XP_004039260.1 leishmanolysin family protein, putative [Ichthyophthirius multifiliis]